MRKIIIRVLLLLNVNLSAEFIANKGTIEYYKSTSDYYTKACENGSTNRCVDLGMLYITGDGIQKNHIKAETLFISACRKKHSKACYHLGSIYKRGLDKKKSDTLELFHQNNSSQQDEKGIEKDLEKSKKFYALGCMYGYAQSCDQYNLIKDKASAADSDIDTNGYRYYTDEIY